MSILENLTPQFEKYEGLDSDNRKVTVRELEAKVRSGDIALTDADFHACTSSQLKLQRILAYLMVQEGRVPITPSVLRSIVTDEMELLKRVAFDTNYSRMPLYYATRAYVERVKTDKSLLTSAVGDLTMLEQMVEDLSCNDVDRRGQVLPKVKEATRLVREAQDKTPETAITASKITLMNQSTGTPVERFQKWVQGHKILSVFVIIGIVVIALGTFTDAITSLVGVCQQFTKPAATPEPIVDIGSATVSLPPDWTLRQAIITIAQNGKFTTDLTKCSKQLLDTKVQGGQMTAKTHKDLIEALQHRLISPPKKFRYKVNEQTQKGIYEIIPES